MAVQSIIVRRPEQRYARKSSRYYDEQRKAFARRMPNMRLALNLRGSAGELVCESYNVQFRHPGALRYFKRQLAEFMKQMDGTVVVEDPPVERYPDA